MRHFFIMLMVATLGFGAAIDNAEARRMGGGKSMGGYSRSASPQSNTATTNSAAQGQRKPSAGLSRFAGPLAGLLAGGLLASLFFGGAFDDLRMLDILLIGGAIFLLMRLLASRRRAAMASGPDAHSDRDEMTGKPQAFQNGSDVAGGASASGSATAAHPAWFDEQRFLNDAKQHFMTLQRAWDNNDFAGIQDYVTPTLYNTLKAERAEHPANNRTEIVRLEAELADVREYVGQTEASVRFHGIIDENGEQNAFSEVWHLIREMRDNAPWHLQGIEQREDV
ncbi:Tim44 domain-containing protein [Halomonas halocynthiae]|uniref:Tim44 domain-containing protein n=1 Tax=Halomonas halocynthiae TaxID=176290 RepID=UPI0003FFDA61|nr:TIM44-like domain-containing protein [Halomonas halocynthiae]